MIDINPKLFTIYIFFFILTANGCVSLKTDSFKSHHEKSKEQVKQSIKYEDDSTREIIEDTPNSPDSLEVKIVGYVNKDILEVFPLPEQLKAINHVVRGTKIFIFDTNGDWANISADIDYPYWVSLKGVCFTSNCWLKTKSYIAEEVIGPTIEHKIGSAIKKSNVQISPNSQLKTNTTLNGKGYKNRDGNYVPSPKKSLKQPSGATAKCRNGTWSFSQNRRGTCSRHGGVASWL